jgi:hypothetical protein
MSMRNTGSTRGRRRSVATREKDARALDLRRRGMTYPQIATELGHKSVSTSYEAVQRAMADVARDAAEEVRALEADRLDELTRVLHRVLLTKHYSVSASGKVARHPVTGTPIEDDGPVIQAVNGLIRVSERRARLLGLDAPQRHEVRTIDAIDARLFQLADEVAGVGSGDAAPVPREA